MKLWILDFFLFLALVAVIFLIASYYDSTIVRVR